MNLQRLKQNANPLLVWGLSVFTILLFWTPSTRILVNFFYLILLPTTLLFGRQIFSPFKTNRTAQLALLFVAYFAVSSFWSPTEPLDTAKDAIRHSFSMLLFISALSFFQQSRSKEIHEKNIFMFSIFAGLSAFLSILFFYSQNPLLQPLSHTPYYFFPSFRIAPSCQLYGFGAICALTAAFLCKSITKKWISFAFFLVLTFALFQTTSRAPRLGLFCAAGTFIAHIFWKKTSKKTFTITCIGILLCAIAITAFSLNPSLFLGEEYAGKGSALLEGGDGLRIPIWTSALDQMNGSWLFGHGLKKEYLWLQTNYANYGFSGSMAHLHSLIFWALYHGGIIGLSLTLILLGASAIKALRITMIHNEPFALAWLAFGTASSIFAGSSFLHRPDDEWLIFWGPIAYIAAYSLSKNTSDTTSHTQLPSAESNIVQG